MTMIATETRSPLLALLADAVAAHANVVQVRLESGGAVVETLAAGRVEASAQWSLDQCAAALPSAFALCDEANDYDYGSSRSARMTGVKTPLPAGVSMVFLQFFPPRDGQRHLVARITYDADTCCGTCGG